MKAPGPTNRISRLLIGGVMLLSVAAIVCIWAIYRSRFDATGAEASVSTYASHEKGPTIAFWGSYPIDEKRAETRSLVLHFDEGHLKWKGAAIVASDTASYINGLLTSQKVDHITVVFGPEVRFADATATLDRLRATRTLGITVIGTL